MSPSRMFVAIKYSFVQRGCFQFIAPCLVVLTFLASARGQERPLPQAWEYADAMRQVVAKETGRSGVVLHIGDSITYSNPYGQWARDGRGQTPEDKAVLQWMRTGANDDTDGWFLARFDDPAGGRSHTACSGIPFDEMLAGGKRGLPALKQLLARYRPQIAVFMLDTNDVSANREAAAYLKDIETSLDLFAESGCVCILSTIPPHVDRPELARSYTVALRTLAQKRRLPLIDYEAERRGEADGYRSGGQLACGTNSTKMAAALATSDPTVIVRQKSLSPPGRGRR